MSDKMIIFQLILNNLINKIMNLMRTKIFISAKQMHTYQ